MKELSSFADYFVICSGRSDRHAQAIADAIKENLKEKQVTPLGIEGYREALWILMDYSDVIVHIFHEKTREVYELEKLWNDAPAIDT